MPANIETRWESLRSGPLIRRCVISKYTRIYLLTRYRYYHGPRWTEARAISLPENETKRVGRRASLLAFAITSNPFSVRYSWPVSLLFLSNSPPHPTHLLFHSLYRTLRERAAVSRHRGIVDAAPPRPSSSPLFPLFSFPSRFLFALLSINSSLPPLLAFFLAMCRGDGARWLSTYVPRFLYFFPFLLVGESRSR